MNVETLELANIITVPVVDMCGRSQPLQTGKWTSEAGAVLSCVVQCFPNLRYVAVLFGAGRVRDVSGNLPNEAACTVTTAIMSNLDVWTVASYFLFSMVKPPTALNAKFLERRLSAATASQQFGELTPKEGSVYEGILSKTLQWLHGAGLYRDMLRGLVVDGFNMDDSATVRSILDQCKLIAEWQGCTTIKLADAAFRRCNGLESIAALNNEHNMLKGVIEEVNNSMRESGYGDNMAKYAALLGVPEASKLYAKGFPHLAYLGKIYYNHTRTEDGQGYLAFSEKGELSHDMKKAIARAVVSGMTMSVEGAKKFYGEGNAEFKQVADARAEFTERYVLSERLSQVFRHHGEQ